jgi:endonuclease-3
LRNILKVLHLIKKQAVSFNVPWVTIVAEEKKDPYRVLISCILSLRTKDRTTAEASKRLFKAADGPRKMIRLSRASLEKLIYPVGFYHTKARVILEASKRILKEFDGKVPSSEEELLSLKGVGRKTANLVLGLGYGIPAICVDTHVHRISNRLGWIKTRTPAESEEELMRLIPKDQWIELNTALVTFGQNVCLPVSPYCSRCFVNKYCKKTGVGRHR